MNIYLVRLAIKNLWRNKRRSFVTFLAIGIGVTLVVVLKGFMAGFLSLMVEGIVEGRTGALQIHKRGAVKNSVSDPLAYVFHLTPELEQKIRAVPGVKNLSGRIFFMGIVSNGKSQTNFVATASDPQTERLVTPKSSTQVISGESLESGSSNLILVGDELAKSFSAHPVPVAKQKREQGEEVFDTLTLSSTGPTGRSNSVDVQIQGITRSLFAFENKRVLSVPLKTAQELLGMDGQVTEIAVSIESLENLDAITAEIREALGSEYEVHDWKELQPFVRDVLNRQRIILGTIGLVLLVMVLFGITNTMLMCVFERIREIGTMLAIGIKQFDVIMLFLVEAAVLGVVGGIFGAVAGSAIVSLFAHLGIRMPPNSMFGDRPMIPEVSTEFVLIALFSAFVGALASAAYPAWRASRLNPVDALRSS